MGKEDIIRERKVLNKIERLEQVSEFFNLDENPNVLRFLSSEFEEINPSAEIKDNYDILRYITIVNNLNNHVELNKQKIIESVLSEDVVNSFEDLKEVSRLKEVFPDEYVKNENVNKSSIDRLIESVVVDAYDNLSYDPKRSDLEEFSEELSFIEEEFNFYTKIYRDKIEEKFTGLDETKEEETKSIKSISSPNYESNNDDEILINIFSSLKHKN